MSAAMASGLAKAGFAEGTAVGPGLRRGAGAGPLLHVIATAGFPDYALLDSGNGRKLERFGRFTVERPESQALWRPALEPGAWLRADAAFKASGAEEDGEGGRWRRNTAVPETWPMRVLGVTMLCRLTNFHHLGIFPEQLPHWEWMLARLAEIRDEPPRVLNLFAYTGAASLLAAAAGAQVTHVDASKKAIAWAKENQAASQLEAAPIRWMLDDAAIRVRRLVVTPQILQRTTDVVQHLRERPDLIRLLQKRQRLLGVAAVARLCRAPHELVEVRRFGARA